MPNFNAVYALLLREAKIFFREKERIVSILVSPLLFLFVFTYVMPHMTGGASMNPTAAMAGRDFPTVLLPGLMAVA